MIGPREFHPRPGATPYKDFLQPSTLSESAEIREGGCGFQTMKNQELTTAARLRPGDLISLQLTSWTDAEPQYGGINRSEFSDENLSS